MATSKNSPGLKLLLNTPSTAQVRWIRRSTDIMFASYLAVVGLLILWFRDRLPHWGIYASLHFCLGLLIFKTPSSNRSPHALRQFLLDWYPVFLFPALYKEIEPLATAFGNWSLTWFIRDLEAILFHGHPSIYLSERLPWVPLSEFLHFSYLAYVFLIPGIGGYWYVKRRRYFFELIFVATLTYLTSYLFYILFPVDSPFYLAAPLGTPFAGHLFYDLVHAVSSHGGARGGAFPSSHVSIATVVFLLTWHRDRRLCLFISPVILGIIVATVYGRFHYTLDAIAGVGLGTLTVGVWRVLLARPKMLRGHKT
jgi:membrane-associated phospholipid phosphatase